MAPEALVQQWLYLHCTVQKCAQSSWYPILWRFLVMLRLGVRGLSIIPSDRRSLADTLRRMVDTVVAELGGLDIAVNNAGINFNNAAEDTPENEWDMTFNLNTKGLFLCCQVPHSAAPAPWALRSWLSYRGRQSYVAICLWPVSVCTATQAWRFLHLQHLPET